jgi:hypothetical protein
VQELVQELVQQLAQQQERLRVVRLEARQPVVR